MPSRQLLTALIFPALVAACPGPEDDDEASLVVGVQADELGGLAGSVRVLAKVDDVVQHDDRASGAVPAASPAREIELRGRAGAKVEVVAEALAPGAPADAPPVVTRLATARMVAGGKKLLRLQLQASCLSAPAPGGPPPLVCAAPETCSFGRCTSSEVPPDQLEDYAPGWPDNAPDACKPARAGDPEVILGTGQTDYSPLADGQTLQLEKGPQGGHHIWIAVRMKNLRQSGSMTTITATLPDEAGAAVPPAAYVFTYDRDEGAYCKLWGLRYQVDSGATDLRSEYKRFLGKRLAVTVEVTDRTGVKASSTRIIQIAPLLLCPDGTTACNEGT